MGRKYWFGFDVDMRGPEGYPREEGRGGGDSHTLHSVDLALDSLLRIWYGMTSHLPYLVG